MINKALEFLARIAVGKHLVAAAAWLHEKLDGKRSEINLALLGVVHLLKLGGVIPPEIADSIEQSLLTLVPVLLADRARKVLGTVDNLTGK